MDGRQNGVFSRLNLTLFALALLGACAWLLPVNARGEAMGKVSLDPVVATTAPAPTMVTPPTTAPASVVSTTPATTPVAIVKPVTPAAIATPTTAPHTEVKTIPTPVPPASDIKPETTPRPPIVDSMSAEDLKRTVLPKEKQKIGGRTVDASGGGSTNQDANTGGASSFIPPGLSSILQVAAALAIVLGLVFIGKAIAKKFIPGAKAGNGKGVIEILARYPLSKNQSLVLVRIGTQIVTLNQGKDQSHSVLVINDQAEVARILGQIEGTSPKSISAGFSNLLANARMDLENRPEEQEQNELAPENLDTQLDEMAAAKRQLMELRQQVRSVRDSLPR